MAQQTFYHACFAAGTTVRTLLGDRAIETIRVGDQVLTQSPETGRLSFQPVVAAYHNKPNRILRIHLDGETVGATPIHRFWKAGVGWTMARDLKPGDAIRAVGGPVRVRSIEQGPIEPVYNLKVAEGQSFFVGKQRLLVHDNSLVRPALRPFDAAPELAAITAPAAAP
ncbi:MAG: polymorphic toxin-type HINT domain-containing protein [Isosphaeraceae bacterium]